MTNNMLTVKQARERFRATQHPDNYRSYSAWIGHKYRQGYYIREDGRLYYLVGAKEYQNYQNCS